MYREISPYSEVVAKNETCFNYAKSFILPYGVFTMHSIK